MAEITMTGEVNRLERRQAVATLLQQRGELLVVTSLGSPTYDVFAAGDHDANFYLWGAMGGAAMTGLGIALAQPDRPVAVIVGDGEQLMGLGGLATIKVSAPKNLSVIVLDNGHYGETGGQVSHSGAGVDLVAVAKAIGIPSTLEVTDTDDLSKARELIHSIGDGPRVIVVRIRHEETPRALPSRDGTWIKNRFRTHLGFST